VLELYHFSISTCSQKVRLVLDEKGIDHVSREVNLTAGEQHNPEYVKLNPNHVVPTLVHDGKVFIESSHIIEYLDDLYPDPPMRPTDAEGRYRVSTWLGYLDKKVHVQAPLLTYALGARKVILQQPKDVRDANLDSIPDPVARAARRSVVENGVQAPEFAGALGEFINMLDKIEGDLGAQAWLSGDHFGLADATAIPYVLRLDDLALEKLFSAEVRPRTADWFERLTSLNSYQSAVAKWRNAEIVDLLKEASRESSAEIDALLNRRD
jgi:glutathione S-transferase